MIVRALCKCGHRVSQHNRDDASCNVDDCVGCADDGLDLRKQKTAPARPCTCFDNPCMAEVERTSSFNCSDVCIKRKSISKFHGTVHDGRELTADCGCSCHKSTDNADYVSVKDKEVLK